MNDIEVPFYFPNTEAAENFLTWFSEVGEDAYNEDSEQMNSVPLKFNVTLGNYANVAAEEYPDADFKANYCNEID